MIEKQYWIEKLSDFPVVGRTVAELLLSSFKKEEVWILRSIETLTDVSALTLGNLWHRVAREKQFPIRNEEIGDALLDASQVIDLYMWLMADPTVVVVIEDGCYWPDDV